MTSSNPNFNAWLGDFYGVNSQIRPPQTINDRAPGSVNTAIVRRSMGLDDGQQQYARQQLSPGAMAHQAKVERAQAIAAQEHAQAMQEVKAAITELAQAVASLSPAAQQQARKAMVTKAHGQPAQQQQAPQQRYSSGGYIQTPGAPNPEYRPVQSVREACRPWLRQGAQVQQSAVTRETDAASILGNQTARQLENLDKCQRLSGVSDDVCASRFPIKSATPKLRSMIRRSVGIRE